MSDAAFDAPATTSLSKFCVLLNGRSGKKEAGPSERDVQAAFSRVGLSPQIEVLDPSKPLEETVRTLVDSGHRTVVAAGGDGTISGVAQALSGTQATMGILPRGTFNYFARSLGIPQDLDDAVDVIAGGHTRSLRLALLNDTVFLNNANFGLYPQILRSREDIYNFWGRSRAAAYWSALKVLFRWPKPLVVSIRTQDKTKDVRTPMIFVLNNAFQLKHMGMEGAQCIEDGQMAMLIAPDQGRFGMLRSAAAMLLGRASRHRDFHLVCSEDFEISTSRRKLLVARDGERCMMSGPFRLSLSHDPLPIIVPFGSGETTR